MNYWIYYVFPDGSKIYCCGMDGFRVEWTAEAVERQLKLFNTGRTQWYKEQVCGNNY